MQSLFSGIYKDKTVLVTGHTGFKGSWLCFWLKKMGANVIGYALEAPTTPSHIELLNLNIISIVGFSGLIGKSFCILSKSATTTLKIQNIPPAIVIK